jgi:serine/threonine protein kinase
VKLPRPHQLTHPRARRTLDREAAALLIGGHPGLPRLLSDGREDDIPHLALEYLDGTALEDELEDHGAMQPGEAALLGVGLLSALRILHRHGLAHLDLKPANLLLRAGLPVLIDFGSAREIGRLQPKGRPIGTAGYAAPDLEAGEPISPAMDLYGVGAVLHEALTGEPTFDPELDAEDRPAAPELPDEVPTALRDLIRSLLAPGPEARPSLADTLLTLAGCAAERPWPQWADRALSPSAGPLR